MIQEICPTPAPRANPEAVIQNGSARFSILTSRLIRIEFDPLHNFEDRPSQVFLYRNQPVPPFNSWQQDGWLNIETSHLFLRFKENGRLHHHDLHITLKKTGMTWHFDDPDETNLGGTIRTLDSTDGPLSIPPGLVSRSGWAVVDDSHSLVFDENAWLKPRQAPPEKRDLYFFGYAHDYLDAIQDYQRISGKPRLLPRFALGNWWSRFWAYTDEELLALMNSFSHHHVPLSICIVDMDWHITKTGNTSSGWTGYTWNRDLFPEPKKFIEKLHKLGLKTALNLHPAEGIHPHEDAFPAMSRALGLDPSSGEPIPFNIADPSFVEAYFQYLHHPLEAQGIDFWWIDWQQGTQSEMAGLDPLFWLNHLHYLDLGRVPQKRSFIFSRWPGLGGHRYPIGFSGDTVVSWASLAFQPEMTATAANVGFGWWSHDIGGHYNGIEDPELYLRWVQFGVFSPIFRIHSTNNEFLDRRPWAFGKDVLDQARSAMQLRHALIPLLYTANWQNAQTGEPLILPMYYSNPTDESAYQAPNQYTFARQLLVAPITRPADPSTKLSRQPVWLPEGLWYDFFTGEAFEGGCWTTVYADRGKTPVFAKAGSIIPLNPDCDSHGVQLPTKLLIKIFTGEDGQFELYEDDGESQSYLDGAFVLTGFSQKRVGNDLEITRSAVKGHPELVSGFPQSRDFQFEIVGVSKPAGISVSDGKTNLAFWSEYNEDNKTLTIETPNVSSDQFITIQLINLRAEPLESTPVSRLTYLLHHFYLSSLIKQQFMQKLPQLMTNPSGFLEIAHYFSKSQLLAIYEAIFPYSENKPQTDITSAYEVMMTQMKKLIG